MADKEAPPANQNEDVDEDEDEEGEGMIKAAYSVSDMMDLLDEEEEPGSDKQNGGGIMTENNTDDSSDVAKADVNVSEVKEIWDEKINGATNDVTKDEKNDDAANEEKGTDAANGEKFNDDDSNSKKCDDVTDVTQNNDVDVNIPQNSEMDTQNKDKVEYYNVPSDHEPTPPLPDAPPPQVPGESPPPIPEHVPTANSHQPKDGTLKSLSPDLDTTIPLQEWKSRESTMEGHTYYNDQVKTDISGRFPVAEGRKGSESSPDHDYEAVYDDVASQGGSTLKSRRSKKDTATRTLDGECIYENMPGPGGLEDTYEDDGFSSSEFESYEEGEEYNEAPEKKKKSHKRRLLESLGESSGALRRQVRNSVSPEINLQASTVLDKIAAKLTKSKKEESEDEDNESMLIDVAINMDKHPPPELPDSVPDSLSNLQIQRRHIVSSMVDSEKSYVNSLTRIVQDYEKPLIDAKPQILSKQAIKMIFFKVRDILQCHNMFHIELAEYTKRWDEEEKIGNVFIASFSKAMVFDAYSAFVNNFTVAMERAKKYARHKPLFAEFLKQRLEQSSDKLSLFGLLVKPVQRFPQFIMLLQDLLKHTPTEHHDRLSLQMALTELETLTHKLNETKRESDNKHGVKQIMDNISGRHTLKVDSKRHLVRQDDMIQVENLGTEIKTKTRRLFLMNDILLCTTAIQRVRDADGDISERFRFKWAVPINEIDVVEMPISSKYSVKCAYGKTTVSKTEPPATPGDKPLINPNNPFKKELDDMLHDLPVVEQVGALIGQLRLKYQGMNMDLVHRVIKTLQVTIQQKSEIDKCIINLSVPFKCVQSQTGKIKDEARKQIGKQLKKIGETSVLPPSQPRNSRVTYTFQVDAPGIKQEWLLELQNVKLAQDPRNNPSWLIPETELQFTSKLPLFIKPLLIDVTTTSKDDTQKSRKKNLVLKVYCAVAVTLPSSEIPGVGTMHLWICSGHKGHGQVTIVSLHSNQYHVSESFKACDSPILCCETVPGSHGAEDKHAFGADTVWMGMEDKGISVRYVYEETRGNGVTKLSTDSDVLCLQYLNNRVYAGQKNGQMIVYWRDQQCIWQFKKREIVKLEKEPIKCLLPVNTEMWAACGANIYVVDVSTSFKSGSPKHAVNKKCHNLSEYSGGRPIECMAKAGVGLILTYKGKASLKLFHLETLDVLQDINVSNSPNMLLEGSTFPKEANEHLKSPEITYMLASKGLLWLGTSSGCVLTFPLPRLEGVPCIKGRPTLSHHALMAPVKFICGINCGISAMPHTNGILEQSTDSQASTVIQDIECSNDDVFTIGGVNGNDDNVFKIGGVTEDESSDYRGFTQSEDTRAESNKSTHHLSVASSRSKWTSTPDLRNSQLFEEEEEDKVANLYGSLLRGLGYEDMDTELCELKTPKRKSTNFKLNVHSLRSQATALNAKVVQSVNKQVNKLTNQPPPPNKYATLPLVEERDDSSISNSSVGREDLSLSNETDNISEGPSIDSQQTADDSLEMEMPPTPTHNPSDKLVQPLSPSGVLLSQNAYNKSIIMVAGGAGHVNYADKDGWKMKHDDLSLLMWQCKL